MQGEWLLKANNLALSSVPHLNETATSPVGGLYGFLGGFQAVISPSLHHFYSANYYFSLFFHLLFNHQLLKEFLIDKNC